MKTAAETIEYGRALMNSGKYWYLDGGHNTYITAARRADDPGIPASAQGKQGFDCVGFCLALAKFLGSPISPTPWSVGKFSTYCSWPKIPVGQQQPGDFAIFGTTHTAVFTNANHVIQAYNEQRGLIETTLKGVGLTLTSVRRPPYAPPPPEVKLMAGITYQPIIPNRLVDTRDDAISAGGLREGAIPANVATKVKVAGLLEIPVTAVAVTGNVTVVYPAGSGNLYLGPTGGGPRSSTLNWPAKNSVVANGFTVGLNADGTLDLRPSVSCHVVIDITGYFLP